jgi:acyl-CoA thioester hydrolase
VRPFCWPARLDDELLVTCEPQSVRGASLAFLQRVLRQTAPSGSADGEALETHALLATAEVRIACVDARSFRPQRLPEGLLEAVARTKSG